MVTSDFAALAEVVQGEKIHTEGEKWGKENTFGDTVNTDKYLAAILDGKQAESAIDPNTYSWETVGKQWIKEITL